MLEYIVSQEGKIEVSDKGNIVEIDGPEIIKMYHDIKAHYEANSNPQNSFVNGVGYLYDDGSLIDLRGYRYPPQNIADLYTSLTAFFNQ